MLIAQGSAKVLINLVSALAVGFSALMLPQVIAHTSPGGVPHEEPTQVPVLGAPLLDIESTPQGLTKLHLSGKNGAAFEVLGADSLAGPWSPVRRVSLSGPTDTGLHSWIDTSGNQKRFFQGLPLANFEYAENFELVDINSRAWSLGYHVQNTNLQAIVLAFVGELNATTQAGLQEFAAAYDTNNVSLWIIDSSTPGSRSNLVARAGTLNLQKMIVLHDRTGAVARGFGVSAFPEFIAVAPDMSVIYRGRMSETNGQPAAFSPLLHDAIKAHQMSQIAGVMLSEPVGIKNPPAATPDYASEIAPMMIAKCAHCHSVGNVGPFAMTNHAVLSAQSRAIREEVLGGHMPPWHVEPEDGQFANDRSLSAEEVAKLVSWIGAGSPRGSSAIDPLTAYVPPTSEWPVELGPPDAIIELPVEQIKATGVEAYRYRHTRVPFTSNVWLRAAAVRPSNTSVAHHILVGTGHHTATFLHNVAGYVPGTETVAFPDGMGRPVAANEEITFELHYTPNGAPSQDRPRLALWLHKNPVGLTEYKVGFAANVFIRIPAGAANYSAVGEAPFDQAVTLYSLTPHMHLRGKSMKFEVLYPDNSTEVLLNVPHYDFHWQLTYRLKEPKRIPAGSVLQVRAVFDNSYMNPHNPDPTVLVRWGEQSFNEMLIGYFDYTD